MSRLRRPALTLLSAVAATMIFGVAAGASVSIPENPIPVSSGQATASVNVSYSGFPANVPLFFNQCRKNPDDATFVFTEDCSPTTQKQIQPGNNTGPGTFSFPVFRGDEPSTDFQWGCYAAGDTPSAGYQKNTTCYIRVTKDTFSNTTDDQYVAFTFVAQGAPVPEAPMAVILPVAFAGVLAAVFLFNRRRQSHAGIA